MKSQKFFASIWFYMCECVCVDIDTLQSYITCSAYPQGLSSGRKQQKYRPDKDTDESINNIAAFLGIERGGIQTLVLLMQFM